MDDDTQARAYSEADFSEPHNMFVDLFRQLFTDLEITDRVLDLGCGPADVSVRFARVYPHCHIDAVDGAAAMLHYARQRIHHSNLLNRISLIHESLPSTIKLRDQYPVIISNSLLHHLADPSTLWDTVAVKCAAGGSVFIMDLMRPASLEQAKRFVEIYASKEPEILQHDFYYSLLASHRPDEIKLQLADADLDWLQVKAITDRHLIIFGQSPECTNLVHD